MLFFEEIQSMLIEIENTKLVDTTIMFLEASDKELVSRYKETRRTHPLAMDGLVTEGIIKERSLLSELKGEAQLVIDTTNLAPRELREKLWLTLNQMIHRLSVLKWFHLALNTDYQLMQMW